LSISFVLSEINFTFEKKDWLFKVGLEHENISIVGRINTLNLKYINYVI